MIKNNPIINLCLFVKGNPSNSSLVIPLEKLNLTSFTIDFSGFNFTFLAYIITYIIAVAWKTIKAIVLSPIPEPIGTSAIPWAIPIVKGLRVAAANPVAVPTITAAPPTRASYPKATDIPIKAGSNP